MQWKPLKPNDHGDWLNLRSDVFESFIVLGSKDKKEKRTFFQINSNGVVTARDSWVYNFSKEKVNINMKNMINFYNQQVDGFIFELERNPKIEVAGFSDRDPSKISWSRALQNSLKGKYKRNHIEENIISSLYRPFTKQYFYFDRNFNECVYQMPKLFPSIGHSNLVIAMTGVGANKAFSVIISNQGINLDTLEKAQCFPLYWFEDNVEMKNKQTSIFDEKEEIEDDKYIRRDGVSDFILKEARIKYGHKTTKEDIFYYVYGLLHSPDYRTAFEADLKKMLPRLPLVDKVDDFWAFSKAGRELADLHLHYETVDPYKGVIPVFGAGNRVDYRVEKMRFGKNGKETNKSTIFYNSQIRIDNIPLEAYDYVVNGKSAIEWIMERYAVTINKDSQIKNDPNDWSREHNDEKYIYNLLLRVITVSVETVKIVNELPKLEF